jgi:Cu/Ag efflux protein CusF
MKLKQIIATLIAAVLVLSLSVSVSAETMFDAAKSVKVNAAYKLTITHDALDSTVKFTVDSDTTITLLMESDVEISVYSLYNSDGEKMSSKNRKNSSGRVDGTYLTWNHDTEFAKGSVDYSILKGTYYLQFKKDTFSSGGNILRFQINDPNADSVTALSLSLSLEEGDEIQLGGIVTPSSAKVTWKSSDSDIATVSSKGLVTAVSAGTATITATAGGKSVKITIIVS